MSHRILETPEAACLADSSTCVHHFHDSDANYLEASSSSHETDDAEALKRKVTGVSDQPESLQKAGCEEQAGDQAPTGMRMIIQNFTPSWFIITMSTGVTSILLHQLPYHARWLNIVSDIFFVLNLVLFLLFTLITFLRYIMYPRLFLAVLRHPHQSLFLATFPVGLATLINMIILVCVPPWGHGMAIFAWVLWWIDSVLALITCFHLTWVMMTNRRPEFAEMTALYLIPIVAIVISATSGGLVASSLTNVKHQLWTLVISYVFWGIGTPLSWIILTMYFMRMTVHKPLEREVIVSLLLPMGPLGLSGFSAIVLGKVARHVFPLTGTVPGMAQAGGIFYIVGLLLGLVLWSFAVLWFIIAIIMIATTPSFPFNMGWWGFIFPVGIFTLLTISIGEEFDFRFFKVLSCVLAGACVLMWLIIAARTIKRVISGRMFFAPCLGTDLFGKKSLPK